MTSDEIQRARAAVEQLRSCLQAIASGKFRDDFRVGYQVEIGTKCLEVLDTVLPKPRRLCDRVIDALSRAVVVPERGHAWLLDRGDFDILMETAKQEAERK